MTALQKTDQVRLVTDAEPKSCHQILEKIEGLRIVQTENKSKDFQYTVTSETENISELCSLVASTLIKNNYKLYELQPRFQDLETIFADITAGATPRAANKMENSGKSLGIAGNNDLGASLQVAER